jgi:hypothetical protein
MRSGTVYNYVYGQGLVPACLVLCIWVVFFVRKIQIYYKSSQEEQSNLKHNKNYIKIFIPPNDHYCQMDLYKE